MMLATEDPITRINNRVKGRIVKETDNEMINKLIRKLIQVDINKRIGWEEYFNDDFFKIKEEKEKNKKAESELNGNLLVK
jgi:serine/threonine protein kinase